MSRYLIAGLILGAICSLIYTIVTVYNIKKMPGLADIVQIFLSAIGILGGIKVIWFVISGDFSNIVKTYSQKSTLSISEDDTAYFFIGGLALSWVSLDAIVRQFITLFSAQTTQTSTETAQTTTPTETTRPEP
jgi:hypothetical protein